MRYLYSFEKRQALNISLAARESTGSVGACEPLRLAYHFLNQQFAPLGVANVRRQVTQGCAGAPERLRILADITRVHLADSVMWPFYCSITMHADGTIHDLAHTFR
jgi:hypothetical protein